MDAKYPFGGSVVNYRIGCIVLSCCAARSAIPIMIDMLHCHHIKAKCVHELLVPHGHRYYGHMDHLVGGQWEDQGVRWMQNAVACLWCDALQKEAFPFIVDMPHHHHNMAECVQVLLLPSTIQSRWTQTNPLEAKVLIKGLVWRTMLLCCDAVPLD